MDQLLSDEERRRVGAPLEQAWTLPPRAYTDPAVFEREVASVFKRDWVCVARVDQVAEPGDHLSVQLLDQPLVVTRGADGRIHTLANVCLHRAMPLVNGAGNGTWLVCPYHQWSYGLDGSLHTAPMMEGVEGFDRGGCRLPALATEVWEGFIFVSAADDPEPLTPHLEPLRRHIENYGFGDLVIAETVEFDSPWNWKILVENFMEAYHHIGPHRETFQPTYPAKDSFVVDNEGGPWSLLRMPGNGDLDQSDGLPFFAGLERDERADLVAASVFPSLLFAASGNMAFWYEVIPDRHDHFLLRIHALLEPDVLADPEVKEALPLVAAGVSHIHEEDIAVNEGPWRGLQAPLTTQGRLSSFEAAIWQFNQRWLEQVDPPT